MSDVAGYVQRKTMLYQTGVEYGDYTMNFVQGCSHGCKFPCYAFMMKKRFGQIKSYEEWCHPYLVSNTLELLDKEIPRLKAKIKSVQLCFSTDPFMYGYPEIEAMALKSIKKLNAAGIKCTVPIRVNTRKEEAHMSRMNELSQAIGELRNAAAALNSAVDTLTQLFSGEEPAEEAPASKPITKEEVRAELAAKSAAGYGVQVRALLKRYGAAQLSAVNPDDYSSLLLEAQAIGTEVGADD